MDILEWHVAGLEKQVDDLRSKFHVSLALFKAKVSPQVDKVGLQLWDFGNKISKSRSYNCWSFCWNIIIQLDYLIFDPNFEFQLKLISVDQEWPKLRNFWFWLVLVYFSSLSQNWLKLIFFKSFSYLLYMLNVFLQFSQFVKLLFNITLDYNYFIFG